MDKKKTKISKEEPEWDKKKIVVVSFLIIILLVLAFSFKNSILGSGETRHVVSQMSKTASTTVDIRKNAQDQINAIKQEAGNINLVDIATSSPQVQKVINDLKALKDYPNNQLKNACVSLCGKL